MNNKKLLCCRICKSYVIASINIRVCISIMIVPILNTEYVLKKQTSHTQATYELESVQDLNFSSDN